MLARYFRRGTTENSQLPRINFITDILWLPFAVARRAVAEAARCCPVLGNACLTAKRRNNPREEDACARLLAVFITLFDRAGNTAGYRAKRRGFEKETRPSLCCSLNLRAAPRNQIR